MELAQLLAVAFFTAICVMALIVAVCFLADEFLKTPIWIARVICALGFAIVFLVVANVLSWQFPVSVFVAIPQLLLAFFASIITLGFALPISLNLVRLRL